MFNKITKSIDFGGRTLTLETGEIGRQASASIIINVDDTVVMVTAVGDKKAEEGRDFFPMTVNYQEKVYAAGKIPGGFFRREGRPSESETLICRLIDRPIRPLFPEGFTNEVQIIATVMSLNPEVDPEILAMIGASAALAVSGMPFNGPIGASRVGYINNEYVLNPSPEQLEASSLDLMVAGTQSAVLMVESEADGLSEDIMLGAVVFGHDAMQPVIELISELADEVGNPKWEWSAPEKDQAVIDAVTGFCEKDVAEAFTIADKMDRYARIAEIESALIDALCADDAMDKDEVKGAFKALEKRIVRSKVLSGEKRIDGRDLTTVRDIETRIGVLPRTHGSALFTRGETQALVVTTLGTQRDAQVIDALSGSYKESFLFHYNFPPFSVGETGRVGSPGRREIGHGRLAKRGMLAVMPDIEAFPYTVRCVSEITESNGSSSMASVCGSSLALMDAGVPIKAPVAGIAMGLIKEGSEFAVLSDILGDEDHLGDMDFKVAGTRHGINALQMDIKIEGITKEIMEIALAQAKEGRMTILDAMDKSISSSRKDVSEFAPRYVTMKVHKDKIREVIGKGGETIRSITEQSGAVVDIDDKGNITISAVDAVAASKAKKMIEDITAEVEVGRVYHGTVSKIMDFGAFITILPGKDGLLHISQISNERVKDVNDHMKEGDEVDVKVIEIDRQGRMRLTMKDLQSSEA